MNELKIRNIDHLGIIAGIVDQMGLVEIINQEMGENSQEKISAGIVVRAMILNGLGFMTMTGCNLYLIKDGIIRVKREIHTDQLLPKIDSICPWSRPKLVSLK